MLPTTLGPCGGGGRLSRRGFENPKKYPFFLSFFIFFLEKKWVESKLKDGLNGSDICCCLAGDLLSCSSEKEYPVKTFHCVCKFFASSYQGNGMKCQIIYSLVIDNCYKIYTKPKWINCCKIYQRQTYWKNLLKELYHRNTTRSISNETSKIDWGWSRHSERFQRRVLRLKLTLRAILRVKARVNAVSVPKGDLSIVDQKDLDPPTKGYS